ncbi:MAG: VOC family protein [Chlamydiia bacterium]|nr:VOC family protein [Chlamydiia bacterium]
MMEHHVGFAVLDLNKIIHFYQDILGFSVLDLGIREGKEAGAPLGLPYVKYKILRAMPPKGDFFIQLIQFLDPKPKQLPTRGHTDLGFNHVGIEVDHIEQIYHKLQSHHIPTESPPIVMKESGVQLLYTRDPEGNILEFVEFPRERKRELERLRQSV